MLRHSAISLAACSFAVAILILNANALAAAPSAANSTVPCAIVLVGNNFSNVADPYGLFTVTVMDDSSIPVAMIGATVSVDFSNCCPGIRLSNTQLGAGVSHAANSAIATAMTQGPNGTATFIIEGASAGVTSVFNGPTGCATISATPSGSSTAVLLTNGIDHPTVMVSTPDEAGVVGTPGVDVADLSIFVLDKNTFYLNNANYHQRSDFDYHLPAYNCSAVFGSLGGFGVNVLDIVEWANVHFGANSVTNGPFPASCP